MQEQIEQKQKGARPKEERQRDFKDFYTIVYPVLGALLGALIAIPIISLVENIYLNIVLLILFSSSGARIAYRNRHVRFFLYILLVGIVILLSLNSQNL